MAEYLMLSHFLFLRRRGGLSLPLRRHEAGCAEGRFRPDLLRKHGLFLLVLRDGPGCGFREHWVLCGKDGEKGRCGAAGEVYSVFVSFGNIRGFEESSFFVYMAIIHQVPS